MKVAVVVEVGTLMIPITIDYLHRLVVITHSKSTINFRIYVPPPPPPPPPPSPSSSPSTPTYNGIAGGANQNVGFGPSQIYGGGTSAVIGQGGFNKAINAGFSVSSIQAWVNRTGAEVGGVLASRGIKPAPGKSYINNKTITGGE
jgi:hypothetical protein